MMPIHGQAAVSGTVSDLQTKAPVAGASVRLAVLGLSAQSDTVGHFSLSPTSVLFRSTGTQTRDQSLFLFRNATAGKVRIGITDLSGRRYAHLFDGELAAGYWRITPPNLAFGLYLCTIETATERHAVRFLASATRTAGMITASQPGGSRTLTKTKTVSAVIDTLLVSKAGYKSVRLPLDSYDQGDLSILLEDTAAVDVADAAIIPDTSWTCFMPEGIPPPSAGTAAFTVSLKYSALHDVGITKFGHRRQFDISGGSVKGEKIDATVLEGGLDYELTLSTGSVELEQIIIIKAGSTPILMRNAGVAPAGGANVRVVLDFEAPNSSSYTWLNSGKFAAERIVDSTAKTITLAVYDIAKTALPDRRITIKDPTDVPNQTWECLKWSGSQGATVFTENVTLGTSISIGASKRGSRNIIPITGGTTSGKVKGKILSGGADYQLGGLDARYTLAPDDGEFIIVRNCGSGGLIPVFEARIDGPYNFLNENKYLSSSPGMGSGGVTITFYEKK